MWHRTLLSRQENGSKKKKGALEMLNNRVNIVVRMRLCKDGIYGSS